MRIGFVRGRQGQTARRIVNMTALAVADAPQS
jgi:hypothetical protein